MRCKLVELWSLWILTAGMVSCGQTEVPAPSPTDVEQEEIVTNATNTPNSSNPTSQRLVAQAKEDLAERLDVETEQIEVVEAKSVVWPDTSLGCPQPGMAYTQVQRDGMLIRLRVEDRTYEYHSGGGRNPFLCEQASKGPGSKPKLGRGTSPPSDLDDK